MYHVGREKWRIPDSVSPLNDDSPFCFQVALAIMGGYAGLFVVVKIGSAMGGKKKEEAAPAPAASSSAPSTGVPSVDSPEFDDFIGSEAFDKLLNSDEQLGKVLADMK